MVNPPYSRTGLHDIATKVFATDRSSFGMSRFEAAIIWLISNGALKITDNDRTMRFA